MSSRPNGPRHDPMFPVDRFDLCENLILLCAADHTLVDKRPDMFTRDEMQQLKTQHETWIKTITQSTRRELRLKPSAVSPYLIRLETGQEIVRLAYGVHAFGYEHDEPQSQDEATIISDFLGAVGDLDILPELGPGMAVQMGFELSQMMALLEERGYWVFGGLDTQELEGPDSVTHDWRVAVVVVKRSSDPRIVQLEIPTPEVQPD